jgi:hypothetical protein
MRNGENKMKNTVTSIVMSKSEFLPDTKIFVNDWEKLTSETEKDLNHRVKSAIGKQFNYETITSACVIDINGNLILDLAKDENGHCTKRLSK